MIKVPGLRFHPEVQENVVYSLYIPVHLCLYSDGQKNSTCFLKEHISGLKLIRILQAQNRSSGFSILKLFSKTTKWHYVIARLHAVHGNAQFLKLVDNNYALNIYRDIWLGTHIQFKTKICHWKGPVPISYQTWTVLTRRTLEMLLIDTQLVQLMTISARSLCSPPYLPMWEIKSFIDNASRFFHFLCFFFTISVMYSLSEGRGFTFGASVTSGTTIKMRRIWAQNLFTKHNASWINLQANNLINKNFMRMEYEESNILKLDNA